ncbi:MAG: hypothetical protein HY781_03125 [Chloroflexi bacterium]|nr:hypothetical protein [Chloroflexota bacterium]
MSNIETVVRQINKELVPQFEARLREHLVLQDRDWLIEQIVRLTLDAHSLHEMDRKHLQEAKAVKRHDRVARVRKLAFDREKLVAFIDRYAAYDRDKLIGERFLLPSAPEKGTDLLTDGDRTPQGNELLLHAKDFLFALLFGDEGTNTHLERTQRELLTLAVPRDKADALDFMKATTELSALGTWQDPERVSNDQRADNVLLEVEFGEVEGELVGDGIVRALSLINSLEINEQILYARMINVEQTTLIS